MPSLAKALAESSLIIWAVLELRLDQLTAPTMELEQKTVSMLKMLGFDAQVNTTTVCNILVDTARL